MHFLIILHDELREIVLNKLHIGENVLYLYLLSFEQNVLQTYLLYRIAYRYIQY